MRPLASNGAPRAPGLVSNLVMNLCLQVYHKSDLCHNIAIRSSGHTRTRAVALSLCDAYGIAIWS